MKKSVSTKKSTPTRVVLKRTIAFFTLLIAAILISRPILGILFEKNNVLGDHIYLASNEEHSNDEDEFKKHEEEKRREYEQQKKQEQERKKEEKENPKVICIGPDNKKFKTSKKECEKLSEIAGKEPEFEIVEVVSTLQPQNTEVPDKGTTEAIANEESTQSKQGSSNTAQQASTSGSQPVVEQRTVPLPETPIEVQAKATGQTIDINSKNIQIELKQENGHIVAKAKQLDGTEIELQDDALFHIEERLAIDKIKIATTSAHEFLIQKNNAAAVTNFPLSWDLTTNTLVVTTPGGRKNVPVLPDQAVQNLIASDTLDQATIPESLRKDRNVHLGTILDIATLTHRDGEPVYQITGVTGQKLFSLFPVAIEKTVAVSGTTGEIVGSNETPINAFIDLISF